jgi:hypothetical protein
MPKTESNFCFRETLCPASVASVRALCNTIKKKTPEPAQLHIVQLLTSVANSTLLVLSININCNRCQMAEQWKIVKNEAKTKNNVSVPDDLQQKHVQYVCKIEGVKSGTGFVCKIPIDDYILYGIMTCKHVVSRLNHPCDLQYCTATFEYAKPPVSVRLSEVIHTVVTVDPAMDAVFLVADKNWIVENKMLFAEEVPEENSLIYEPGMDFYSYHYAGGEKLWVGSGTTGEVREGNIIAHNMSTKRGSSGAPLISKRTDTVIAMHVGEVDQPVEPFLNGALKIVPFVNEIKRQYHTSWAFLKNNACKHFLFISYEKLFCFILECQHTINTKEILVENLHFFVKLTMFQNLFQTDVKLPRFSSQITRKCFNINNTTG